MGCHGLLWVIVFSDGGMVPVVPDEVLGVLHVGHVLFPSHLLEVEGHEARFVRLDRLHRTNKTHTHTHSQYAVTTHNTVSVQYTIPVDVAQPHAFVRAHAHTHTPQIQSGACMQSW